MYTKCIPHFDKSSYTRTLPAKFCMQNVHRSLPKCGIHFVEKRVVWILYTKFCRNVRYISYRNILYTFCIHIVYINSDPGKVYIINIMYAILNKMHTESIYK